MEQQRRAAELRARAFGRAPYDGSNWITSSLGADVGAGPFTRSISGISSFREFCVSDGDALLNNIGTGISDQVVGGPLVFPNPASDRLFVMAEIGSAITQVRMIDMAGRAFVAPVVQQGAQVAVDVSSIPTRSYLLELNAGLEPTAPLRIVIAR